MQYAIVAVDYFTKWVEAEVLASITPEKIKEFVYKTLFTGMESPTPSYLIMEYSLIATNSRSSTMTSRSRRSLVDRTASDQWVGQSCEQEDQAQPEDKA